jgi:hypothetical protein
VCPHGPSGPDLLFAPKCVVPWSCGHFEGKGGLKQVDLGIPGYPIFRYSHFMRSMDILNMLFKMAMTVKFESLGLGVVRRFFAEPKSRNGTGTLEPHVICCWQSRKDLTILNIVSMLVGQIDNLGMGIVPIHFVNFDGFIRESPQSDSEADSDPEAAGPGNWIAFWHGKTQTWPIHDMSYNTHTQAPLWSRVPHSRVN